ncbi:hypothetical protein [Niastella populi]|uniref:hypothetical protein n=1 Tax=Niastella populi TaxID=550983 RepID=UPI001F60BD72|nr:hypothetical protein [Niastella populi]
MQELMKSGNTPMLFPYDPVEYWQNIDKPAFKMSTSYCYLDLDFLNISGSPTFLRNTDAISLFLTK